jgi:hypothetical protein
MAQQPEVRKKQPLPEDFRQYYGNLTAYWQSQGTLNSEIQLCRTLYDCLKIGLYSENREHEYSEERKKVDLSFKNIGIVMNWRERRLAQESAIFTESLLISGILLPLLVYNRFITLNAQTFERRQLSNTNEET